MDVILDSNVYLSDIRMESIRFKNLFDYLRRTKSALVLPRIVREETVARYKHQFILKSKKAEQAVEELNRLLLDPLDRHTLSTGDVKYAIRDLRKKFLKPGKGVKVHYYPDVRGIDIADVYLRGVNRRRPADSDGEELRDVILWLIVLQYAQASKGKVAFITNDGGFWEEATIHPDIQADIQARNVTVQLFRTLEDFVRQSSPASQPVSEQELTGLVDVNSLAAAIEGITLQALKAASSGGPFGRGISAQTAHLIEATFAKGNRYQITADTTFFEVEYSISVDAQERDWTTVLEPTEESPSLARSWTSFNVGPEQGPMTLYGGIPKSVTLYGGMLNPPPGMSVAHRAIINNYQVRGTAYISVRLVEGKAPEIELDRVEVSEYKRVPTANAAEQK